MKKIRKSTGVALAFLIYVSVTAAYLLPRNTEVSLTEKIITVAVSYVIVFLLWLVLRKKEQMRERRKKDDCGKFSSGPCEAICGEHCHHQLEYHDRHH